jgi:hypothetical protein
MTHGVLHFRALRENETQKKIKYLAAAGSFQDWNLHIATHE